MYIYIYHISTWLFAFRVGREEHQTDLDWALWFCWSRCCHMRLAAPAPRQHSKTCVAQSSAFLHLCLESLSLFFSLSFSPSLHPSRLHVCLCISIFSSLCICVCLLCRSVCLIVTRKERLYKFKGTPGIKVSSLSLSLSLSLAPSPSLSHFLSISLASLSMCLSSDFETPR